jgi:hypothetical protein
MTRHAIAGALVALGALAFAGTAPADVKITDQG